MKTRKIIAIFIILSILTSFCGIENFNALAEDNTLTPNEITLSFYDTNTISYGVTWHTDSAGTAPYIQVVKGIAASDDFINCTEIPATVKSYSSYSYPSTSITDYVNKGVIDNLDYNTTYSYRVGDKVNNEWSAVGSFTTRAQTIDNFTFLHMSDTQEDGTSTGSGTGSGWNNAFKGAFAKNPDAAFTIHTGDAVEWSKYESYWKNMLNYNQSYLLNNVVMTVSGNHDTTYRNGTYEMYKHFNFDVQSTQSTIRGYYYSFDYGNAHFVMLNTNNLVSNALEPAQYNWLISDLQANTKKWTIVALHNEVISPGQHGTEAITIGLQNQLMPIFAEYNVDLILQGHDHVYFRTYPMNSDGTIITDTKHENINGVNYLVDPKGPIYTMCGVTGLKTRSIPSNADISYYEVCSASEASSWQAITVSKDVLTVNGYYYYGGDIKLYDSYGIKKQEVLNGDANDDGSVNAKDMLLIKQYFAEWDVTINFEAADVNADGYVNSKDSLLLRQRIAEWPVTLGKRLQKITINQLTIISLISIIFLIV